MRIKLAGIFSVAAIAIAVYLAEPMETIDTQTATTAMPTLTDDLQPRTGTDNPLAHSSIFPAFVSHPLPIANIADIAIGVAIQDKSLKTDALKQENPQNEKTSPEDSVKRLQLPAKDTTASSGDETVLDSALPQRGHDDVAFLKLPSAKNISGYQTSMTNLIVGLPAIRIQNNSDVTTNAIDSPRETLGETPENLTKVSTAWQKMHDFRTILSPTAFQRAAWQDMSFNMYSGVKKSETKTFVVAIDPGHGGVDPGSKGHNGLLEKDLTLDIAKRVRLFLSEVDNIDVQLTRQHDYGLSRQDRVDAIKSSKADMVISLHFNHLPQTDVNLVESYYASRQNIEKSLSERNDAKGELHRANSKDVDLDFTEGSARLARTIQQHIYSEVSFDNKAVQNAGVKQQTFFVLTRSFTPAALIEISCLSHAEEADRLASDDYRNRLAAAIVDGIRNYHDSIQRAPLNTRDALGA